MKANNLPATKTVQSFKPIFAEYLKTELLLSRENIKIERQHINIKYSKSETKQKFLGEETELFENKGEKITM